MPDTKTITLSVIGPQTASTRASDIRRALLLTYITLGWMTIEAGASLFLGWLSKSLLLEAFGIDSLVELFSAAVLLWRLQVEARGRAGNERLEAVERRAARIVGFTLYVLAVYVLVNSSYGLFISQRLTDTHESAWGILIGLVAKIGMPILAGYKLKIAARLNSRGVASGCHRVHHLRLPVDRSDGRPGRDADLRVVVARQCRCPCPHPLLDQGRPGGHQGRMLLLCRRMTEFNPPQATGPQARWCGGSSSVSG